MSGTAICGACDCGRLRKGGRIQHRKIGEKLDVWANVNESFYFATSAEAEAKMCELHQAGITGWTHIVRKRVN